MKKTIDEFLDNEYREYAETVSFKRALPSLVDGFKPTRRKLFYYMKHNKSMIRVSAIAGGIAEKCNYHHGEASAQGTIITMSKSFPSANNYPIFIPKGTFGSKILPKSAAAARYLHAQYNPLNDYIFLDNELLPANKEIDSPEPEFYLPIVPLYLVNGISGIGIGYAVNILPRKFTDVIDMITAYLKEQKITECNPYFNNCKYQIEKVTETSYRITGQYKIVDKKVTISEYLPNDDRTKIISNLIDLKDKGIIKSYKDESKENWNISIEFSKSVPESKVVDVLNLSKLFHENYTLLDETGNIKVFSNATEIIKSFVDHRLTYYTKRREYLINQFKQNNERLSAVILFIQNLEKISKMNEDEIYDYFKQEISNENISYCLKQPLNWFLKKNISDYENKIQKNNEMICYYQTISNVSLYRHDLSELSKRIKVVDFHVDR
jgi:DNA topoisomerase II